MNADDKEKPTPGKAWATTGFLLGIAVSVAGNVAHTYHPAPVVLAAAGKTAEQWRPELGAQLGAAFFPLALLVTVEVLSRVQWPNTWGWSATRYGGAALVAGVAAIVSYLHLRGLLLAYGEDGLTALIGPLSVDGLMIVAGFALLAGSHSKDAAAVAAPQAEAPPHAAPAAESDLEGFARSLIRSGAVSVDDRTRKVLEVLDEETASSPAHQAAHAALYAAQAAPALRPAPVHAPLRIVSPPDLPEPDAADPGDDSADGTSAAPEQQLVSASNSPEADPAVPVVGNVAAAVRLLLKDGVKDPAAIKEKVPTLLGRDAPAATIDRALRRFQSEAADTKNQQGTGAYL